MILEILPQCLSDPDVVCSSISGVLTHIITGIITFGAGIGIAFYSNYIQNRPNKIREKTRVEAIQKLKLENMIEIIYGTKEFKLSVGEMGRIISGIARTASMDIEENPNLTGERVMIKAVLSVQNNTKETSQKIEGFMFLLEKEIIINGKNKAIMKEIKNIRNIYTEMQKAFESDKKLNEMTHNDVHEIVARIIQKYTPDKEVYKTIDEIIEKILEIYKEKLN